MQPPPGSERQARICRVADHRPPEPQEALSVGSKNSASRYPRRVIGQGILIDHLVQESWVEQHAEDRDPPDQLAIVRGERVDPDGGGGFDRSGQQGPTGPGRVHEVERELRVAL